MGICVYASSQTNSCNFISVSCVSCVMSRFELSGF